LIHYLNALLEHIPGGRGGKKGKKKARGRKQIKVVDGCDVTANLGMQ
jgi:hypothetical protein